MGFGCSNLPFLQLLQRETGPRQCQRDGESHDGDRHKEMSLQGEGKGWDMPGVCVSMFSLGSSQLILGGGGRRGRNKKSFPPPLPGPLPELRLPSGWNGDARPACARSSSENKSETSPRDSPVPAEPGAKGRSGSCWLRRDGCSPKVVSEWSNG